MAEPEAVEAPRPWWRRILGWIALGVGLIAVALGAGALALFYPLLHDDYQLDQAVLAVALDWRDFGEERARQRLQLEVAERAIQQPRVEDCVFVRDEELRVRCAWGVAIALPGGGSLPLSFESRAVVTASGDLK